jgi:serine/threonine protein kinase
LIDYEIQLDSKGRKKPIGTGAWSDVYLATPITHWPATSFSTAPAITPPVTPVHLRGSSATKDSLPVIPPLYAIKVPASTSAKKVLSAEARILSYLSRYPDANNHVVQFFGQDSRTGALVLQAMDGTLEDWIQITLNSLDDSSRTTKLASTFPTLALSLIDSLLWLQDKDCVHADIKPSNILYSKSATIIPHLVFTDFSSTVLTTLNNTDATPPPMGAGTWEFLDPSLLSSFNPATPSASTDLYSLAITLLFVVLGASPFDGFKHNKFQQREMIKSGAPLQCLQYDDEGIKNLRKLNILSKDLGFDVQKWFAKVLVKDHAKRVGVLEWRGELVARLAERKAKI